MRSSHLGMYQVALPSRTIMAGMKVMRTRKASNSTAAPSAKPKICTNGSGWKMKLANTPIMISAATVTTFAPMPKPNTTESSTGVYVEVFAASKDSCLKRSRMRDTMNIW